MTMISRTARPPLKRLPRLFGGLALSLGILLSHLTAQAADGPKVEKDIPYLGENRKEKADFYLPEKAPAGLRLPVVLIIHGGGWVGGDKGAAREQNIGNTLVQHGYAALSINYKLGEKGNSAVAWPQNIHDCKTAVRWLRVNADKYHLDGEHIGVIGGSAGGHLASLLGVTGPNDGLDPAEPYGKTSTRVNCVVDLYGPVHMNTGPITGQSNPRTSVLNYLDKSDPPFLILHGTADTTVSLERSRELAAGLKKAGITHELIEIEGAPHTFHLQPKQRDLRPVVLGFLDKHLKGK